MTSWWISVPRSRHHYGAISCCVAAFMAITPQPLAAESVADWQPIVAEASARFGVPIDWINRVMRAESRGRTSLAGRPITSSAGAMGLMQLMPLTWRTMRAELRLGDDPYDPHDNIVAGTAYLRILYDRFGYPGLYAAYNAGPGRYAAHLGNGRPLPVETRRYVIETGGDGAGSARRTLSSGLFVTFGTESSSASLTGMGQGGLFALRRADR